MRVKKKLNKIIWLLQSVMLVIAPILAPGTAQAAFLTVRSIVVGTPLPSQVTTHKISFNINTASTLGSIQFQYCENDPFVGTPCTVPPGLSLLAATLTAQTGETGFVIDPSSTANNILLTRAAAASATGPVSYTLSNVTNPSGVNVSTYVRLSTYISTNGSGTPIDQGSVVFSTAGNFNIGGFVPPFLIFCTAIIINTNCNSFSGDAIDLGTLKSTQTASATSQSAAATNDPTGYVIYSLGTTMTSGNNTIPAMAIPNPSLTGFGQFGINLRDNNNPNNGQNISGAGSGAVKPNYNTPDLYMYSPGDAIAEATQATDFNVYTTSYIVNIPSGQAPGVYVTTMTYMAVAQF